MSLQDIDGKYRKPLRDRDTDDLRMKIAQQTSTDKLREYIAALQAENEELKQRIEALGG